MLTRQELANELSLIVDKSIRLLGITVRCALLAGSIWLWKTNFQFDWFNGEPPGSPEKQEAGGRLALSILSIVSMLYFGAETKFKFERWVRADPNAPVLKIKTIPHSHKVKPTAGQLSETKETGQISYSME